ncbi:hypothetical protein JTE90_006369 [Oedothorax gibbosus]|uniref:Uncharacterized protein n=1 Tax=Oedothorax gibbosus TaxID=931172 RepID=A0AAV6VV13_9ARAC|nr:hypothetical protein JTE90_006369 [Oedothorax gibbosus]
MIPSRWVIIEEARKTTNLSKGGRGEMKVMTGLLLGRLDGLRRSEVRRLLLEFRIFLESRLIISGSLEYSTVRGKMMWLINLISLN